MDYYQFTKNFRCAVSIFHYDVKLKIVILFSRLISTFSDFNRVSGEGGGWVC